MSKLCKKDKVSKNTKKAKYACEKCGNKWHKEKKLCKPKKLVN